MAKVNFFDRRVIKKFLEITAVISGTLSFVVIFVDVPTEWKLKAGLAFLERVMNFEGRPPHCRASG